MTHIGIGVMMMAALLLMYAANPFLAWLTLVAMSFYVIARRRLAGNT